jgi:prepilin-type N-terminal cleavage/methylation domain-containing protein
MSRHSPTGVRAGFTLIEVAVTLVIVGIGLVLVLQGLTSSKMAAAETHYRKVARELALLTLGQVEAGLFWEDLDGGGDVLTGTYAEDGYEEFHYELVLGDEDFSEQENQRYDKGQGYYDNWQAQRERDERAKKKDDSTKEDEEETAKPFEKVRIKVTYPQLGKRPSTLVLERWMAWDSVYGTEKDSKSATGSSSSSGSEEGK